MRTQSRRRRLPLALILSFVSTFAHAERTVTVTAPATCPALHHITTTTLTQIVTVDPPPSSSSSSSYEEAPPPPPATEARLPGNLLLTTPSFQASSNGPVVVVAQPPRLKTSPDGSCGGGTGYTCTGDPGGGCCSQYGWCGWSEAYCGAGCQREFGECHGLGPVLVSSKVGGPLSLSLRLGSSTKTSSGLGGGWSIGPPRRPTYTPPEWLSLFPWSSTTTTSTAASPVRPVVAIKGSGGVSVELEGVTSRSSTRPSSRELSATSSAPKAPSTHATSTRTPTSAPTRSSVSLPLVSIAGSVDLGSLPPSRSSTSSSRVFSVAMDLSLSSTTRVSSTRRTPSSTASSSSTRSSSAGARVSVVRSVDLGSSSPQRSSTSSLSRIATAPPASYYSTPLVSSTQRSPSGTTRSSSIKSSAEGAKVSIGGSLVIGRPESSSPTRSTSGRSSSPTSRSTSTSHRSSGLRSSTTVSLVLPTRPTPTPVEIGPNGSLVFAPPHSSATSNTRASSSRRSSSKTSVRATSTHTSATARPSTSVASKASRSPPPPILGASSTASTGSGRSSPSLPPPSASSPRLVTDPPFSRPTSLTSRGSSSANPSRSSSQRLNSPSSFASGPSSGRQSSQTFLTRVSSSRSTVPAFSRPALLFNEASRQALSRPHSSSARHSSRTSSATAQSSTVGSSVLSLPGSLASSVLLSSTPLPTSNTVSIPGSQSIVRAASSVSAPQPTATAYICPNDNGTTFKSQCGSKYQLHCGIGHTGGDLSTGSPVYVASFAECVAACDRRPACVDVSFYPNSGPSLCYLKGTVGFKFYKPNVWTATQLSYGRTCPKNPNGSPRASSGSSTLGPSSSSISSVVSSPPSKTSTRSSSRTSACTPSPSSKRGLVAFNEMMGDYQTWIQPCSPISWYYNYNSQPYAQFVNTNLQYVPMLWGNDKKNFTAIVLGLISQGYNITHALAFNEPDQPFSVGGSNLDPATAAARWKEDIEPLARHGVKLGAPAISYNVTWLTTFYQLCAGCTIDFIPYHWYGPIWSPYQGGGFYDRYYEMADKFPGATFWITEWADTFAGLATTQDEYVKLTAFMESRANIQRHAYFGSFRSTASNVGYNASMLDECGRLTDIGDRYLNRPVQGNVPHSGPCH